MALDNLGKYNEDRSIQNDAKKIKEEPLDAFLDIRPENHILPKTERIFYGNTKAQNTLLKIPFNKLKDRKNEITLTPRTEKDNKYFTYIYFDTENITLPDNYNYTLQDETILSVIGNIYDELAENGKALVTVKSLINYMNGKPKNTAVSDTQIDDMVERINNLSSIKVRIDAKGHKEYNQKNKHKVQLEETYFKGAMIHADLYVYNGIKWLQILNAPPLYQYGKSSGQRISFSYEDHDLTAIYTEASPGNLIEAGKTSISNMTPRIRSIRTYIYKEIGRVRGGKNRELKISYDTLYKYLSEDTDTFNIHNRSSRQRINKNIEKVLDALQQKGLIKKWNYTTGGAGGRIKTAIITLPTE